MCRIHYDYKKKLRLIWSFYEINYAIKRMVYVWTTMTTYIPNQHKNNNKMTSWIFQVYNFLLGANLLLHSNQQ